MAFGWHAVVAITASRLLRAELRIVAQDSGNDFEYANSVPHGRRYANRRPMIIVGADLVARVRNPLACGGFVVVATAGPDSRRMFAHAGRIGAVYVIGLPGARSWLAHQLLHDLPDLLAHRRIGHQHTYAYAMPGAEHTLRSPTPGPGVGPAAGQGG
jgi:hypothetical protein